MATRQLVKHKVYMVINLVGLAFALSCCILSYSNYIYRSEFDQNHTRTENIYRINVMRQVDGSQQPWGITPAPLGRFLQQDISSVGTVTRFASKRVVVKAGDHVFHETIHFADKTFFDWFDFPLKAGNETALANQSQLTINQNIAEKYFGKENPIGKHLLLIDEKGHEKTYEIGAILAKIPSNSSFQLEIITNYANLSTGNPHRETSWINAEELSTFIKIPASKNRAFVEGQFTKYLNAYNQSLKDWKVSKFYLQPFRNIAYTSDRDLSGFVDGRVLNSNPRAVPLILPAVLSVLILIITCFNFTNTAIAFAGTRLKEIGVRKVLGGGRRQLISQFLLENIISCFAALLVALLLTESLLPYFNQWLQVELKLDYLGNLEMIGFLGGLTFITALISGIYPAFYISSFQPVAILKGKTRFSTGVFNKVLLTVQFSICAMALLIGLVLTQNANYQQQVSMGYDMTMLDVVPVANEKEFHLLQNTISKHPKIITSAGTQGQIGTGDAYPVKAKLDKTEQEVHLLRIGVNYLPAMGVKIVKGRDFNAHLESDYKNSILVNQTFAEQMNLAQPLGTELVLDSLRVRVVGVVQDYKENGNHGPIPPMAFRPVKAEAYQYLTLKAQPENLKEIRQYVEAEWRKVLPNVPFQAFYQVDVLEKEFRMNNGLKAMSLTLAMLIMLLSAVGLYGLVSLNILKRLKEVGMRKVLGASVSQIIYIITRGFMKLLFLSFVIGSALGYLFVSKLVFKVIYTYHTNIGWWPFVATLVAITGGAALTVGFKVYQTAHLNPSNILKNE